MPKIKEWKPRQERIDAHPYWATFEPLPDSRDGFIEAFGSFRLPVKCPMPMVLPIGVEATGFVTFLFIEHTLLPPGVEERYAEWMGNDSEEDRRAIETVNRAHPWHLPLPAYGAKIEVADASVLPVVELDNWLMIEQARRAGMGELN